MAIKRSKTDTTFFHDIPPIEGHTRLKTWKRIEKHQDALSLTIHQKQQICKHTDLPISQNRAELHPKHIAETGYCQYCGRLK